MTTSTHLVRVRRFLPLFVTQLLGAFNDNLFKNAMVLFVVYSVYSYHSQYTEAGLFSCYAGTTPARAQEVIGLLRRELDDVAEGGLTAEEFDRAKGHVKGSMVLSLEDPGSRMSRIGKSEIAPRASTTTAPAMAPLAAAVAPAANARSCRLSLWRRNHGAGTIVKK